MTNTIGSNSNKKINEYCQAKLKSHFDQDKDFLGDFTLMFYFYSGKFNHNVSDTYKAQFEDYLYKSAVSQFYNGYFMAKELLDHEDSVFPDEWFRVKDGMLKERIPSMLFDAAGSNFHEMIRTETSNKLVSWAITKFEDIRDLLQNVFVEMTLLGSVQAFLDEREERGIEVPKTEEGLLNGLLGPYDDLLFIDPQKYLVAMFKNGDSETWEINLWSALRDYPKIGEVNIHRLLPKHIDTMGKHFPLYENQVFGNIKDGKYYVSILLHDTIREGEIAPLIDSIVQKVMNKNGITKNEIILTVPFVNGYLQLDE